MTSTEIENFAWGDAFAALTKRIWHAKYFSEDYVIPSPKLNEHQKKGSSPEIEVFFFFAKNR